jgi:hypothetical protein
MTYQNITHACVQNILYSMIHYPSIDVLSGLVIIAFHEHASGRIDGTITYPNSHMICAELQT